MTTTSLPTVRELADRDAAEFHARHYIVRVGDLVSLICRPTGDGIPPFCQAPQECQCEAWYTVRFEDGHWWHYLKDNLGMHRHSDGLATCNLTNWFDADALTDPAEWPVDLPNGVELEVHPNWQWDHYEWDLADAA